MKQVYALMPAEPKGAWQVVIEDEHGLYGAIFRNYESACRALIRLVLQDAAAHSVNFRAELEGWG